LVTLLADQPQAWSDLTAALPDEVFDRIDRYPEVRLP
jgi:hypothetical protein